MLMYNQSMRISYYDLDMHGRLRLSALLRMIHTAADVNACDLGIGFSELSRHDLTFILQRISFRYFQIPVYGQEVEIRTWPQGISKGTFMRLGDMHDSGGGKMIEWASMWILFNTAERRIAKPSVLPTKIQGLDAQGVEIRPKKIVLPMTLGEPFSSYTHAVRYRDTDTNTHMNNSVYGDLIGNAIFPAPLLDSHNLRPWQEAHINYLQESWFGTSLVVSGWALRDDFYILGTTGVDKRFAAHILLHP